MSLRACLGCSKVGQWTYRDRPSSRCPTCLKIKARELEADPARRAYKAQRYGADHQALKNQYRPLINEGIIRCGRCGKTIYPQTEWHLDHMPNGSEWPSHSACNYAGIHADRLLRDAPHTIKTPSVTVG